VLRKVFLLPVQFSRPSMFLMRRGRKSRKKAAPADVGRFFGHTSRVRFGGDARDGAASNDRFAADCPETFHRRDPALPARRPAAPPFCPTPRFPVSGAAFPRSLARTA